MSVAGHINRSPKKPSYDLTDYEWLVGQWLVDCSRHALPETVRGYRQKIAYFGEWWAAAGEAHEWLLTESLLCEFEEFLRIRRTWLNKPLAYNTRKDALRRLAEMFRWAYSAEIISVDLSKWIPAAQGAAPVRHAATLEQLALLLDAADKTSWPSRSRAILALLLGAGLRRREAVANEIDERDMSGLLIENISFYAGGVGVLNVVGKRTSANPTGVRQVAFDAEVGGYLLAYLDELGETGGPLLRHARFRDRPVGHRGVYYTVKEMIRIAGLESVIDACHQLRRNYSHYWIKLMDSPIGADLLRRNLGHKEFKQTSAYTMLDASDILPHATSPFAIMRRGE